jgi:O-antigen/teichoic acid export membrane protein
MSDDLSAPVEHLVPPSSSNSVEIDRPFASEFRRTVGHASALNVLATAASALAGLLIARYLGASLRGDYAAVTIWFGVALIVGELGQPAAICYFAAKHKEAAGRYVTTSRNIMLVSGALVAGAGWFLAPVLAHDNDTRLFGYRLMFLSCIVTFVGASYIFGIQARSIHKWMIIRAFQPLLYLLVVGFLKVSGNLTLRNVFIGLAASIAAQAVVAYVAARSLALTNAHAKASMTRDLLSYGASQLLATTPTTVNLNLDQVVLAQLVAAASLGRYALAVSLTSLSMPVISPIGSVLFPRIAAATSQGESSLRLQRLAIVLSGAISALIMAAVSAASVWLIIPIFGPTYRGTERLVWVLAAGGALASCNQVMGDLLRGRGRPLSVAWSQGCGAIVTIIMLAVLVPAIGVMGAAITSTASYAVSAVALAIALLDLYLPKIAAEPSREQGMTGP